MSKEAELKCFRDERILSVETTQEVADNAINVTFNELA